MSDQTVYVGGGCVAVPLVILFVAWPMLLVYLLTAGVILAGILVIIGALFVDH